MCVSALSASGGSIEDHNEAAMFKSGVNFFLKETLNFSVVTHPISLQQVKHGGKNVTGHFKLLDPLACRCWHNGRRL